MFLCKTAWNKSQLPTTEGPERTWRWLHLLIFTKSPTKFQTHYHAPLQSRLEHIPASHNTEPWCNIWRTFNPQVVAAPLFTPPCLFIYVAAEITRIFSPLSHYCCVTLLNVPYLYAYKSLTHISRTLTLECKIEFSLSLKTIQIHTLI